MPMTFEYDSHVKSFCNNFKPKKGPRETGKFTFVVPPILEFYFEQGMRATKKWMTTQAVSMYSYGRDKAQPGVPGLAAPFGTNNLEHWRRQFTYFLTIQAQDERLHHYQRAFLVCLVMRLEEEDPRELRKARRAAKKALNEEPPKKKSKKKISGAEGPVRLTWS